MNTTKIEQIAVDTVRGCFDYCDKIIAQIPTNEKTMAWDGYLYLYNDSSGKKSSYYARIPVQVKGETVLDNHPNEITYSIDINDLKAYKDDGIAFFVVFINKKIKTVYYVLLAPIEIKGLLSVFSDQKSKSTSLKKLNCSDPEKLELSFREFYNDCKRQKSVVDLPILSFADLKNLGNPKLTIYGFTASDIANLPRSLTNKDTFIYANIEKGAINLPYPVGSGKCSIAVTQKIEKQVFVGNKAFFDCYTLIYNRDNDIFSVGRCFQIISSKKNPDHIQLKAGFDIKNYNLSEAINTLEFLLTLSKVKHLTISGFSLDMANGECESMFSYLKGLKNLYDRFVKLKKALDVLHVKEDLDLKMLKKESDRIIDIFIAAFVDQKEIIEKQKLDFITEIALCNINILILATKTAENTYRFDDFFNCPYKLQGCFRDDKVFPITTYSILNKEMILKYSNIDYLQVLPSFKSIIKDNPNCFHLANTFGLYLLLAYDEQKNKDERLINTAKEIFEWLLETDNEELSKLSSRLNLLQIKKRLGLMGNSEKEELFEIAEKTESDDVKFAVYLLLDEQVHAMRCFDKLNGDVQDFYRTLPIFHFVK